MGMATGALAQEAMEGRWQTQPDDGALAHIVISPCGSAYCGVIEKAFDTSGAALPSANIGRQIVIDMVPQGGNYYKGSVWRPSNDKVYIGDIRINGDQMTLRGCVGVCTPLTSASQTWVRVP